MKIESWGKAPLAEIVYLSASPSGGADTKVLSVDQAFVDKLPDDLDAILVASDLQGIVTDWAAGGVPVLLGEHLAEIYLSMADSGTAPSPARVGVVLAGDLFSAPDASKRGATGDVRDVWAAFGASFRWVVGVQGNHDQFGTPRERERLFGPDHLHLLDGGCVSVDGLVLGGVGLVVGNPEKQGRRSEDEFLHLLRGVLKPKPDIVVLHEGPNGDRGQRGNQSIRTTLEAGRADFSVCGHTHWDSPLYDSSSKSQFLNVDGRAVLLSLRKA